MASKKSFSARGKILGLTAVALLLVLALVGYASADDSTSAISAEELKNQTRYLSDQKNQIKNQQSDLNQIKKSVKAPASIDTTAADSAITQFSSCIQNLQSVLGTSDFWPNSNECNSLSRDIQDAISPLRDISNCYQTRRNIQDRQKEKKNNIDSQIKNILRSNKDADISALKAIVDSLDAQFGKFIALGTTCDSSVNEQLNDIQNEINPLYQDFYSTSDDVNRAAEDTRRVIENKKDFEKNIKRQCEKDMGRRVKEIEKQFTRAQKKLSPEVFSAAEEGYSKMKTVYEQLCGATGAIGTMQSALDSGNIDNFESARQDFFSSSRDFWDVTNDAQSAISDAEQRAENLKHATRDLKQKTKDIARMKKDLDRMKKQYDKLSTKYVGREDRKDALVVFNEFIGQAQAFVAKVEEGMALAKEEAQSNPDEYWYDHGGDLNDLFDEFNDIQNRWQMTTNILQTLQGVGKEANRYTSELAAQKRHLSEDQVSQLQDIINRANEYIKQAWTKALTSPEEAQESLQSLQDLHREWEDVVNPGDERDDGPTPEATLEKY